MFGLALGVSAINVALLMLMSIRLFQAFQQCTYRPRQFLRWIFDARARLFVRFASLAIVSFGLMTLKSILAYIHLEGYYWFTIGLVFYIGLGGVLIWDGLRQKAKLPLKWTPRVIRLFVVTAIISFAMTFLFVWLGSAIIPWGWLGFGLIAVTPLLIPDFMLKAHVLLFPYEAATRQKFIRRAKRKLFSAPHKNLIRIGITGSYGKTSVKNILAKMLEKKFTTAVSPASFNTPMGFAKTVNDVLQPDTEVLIFEMGLRYTRDIAYLCKLFEPQHGILTSIGTAHIETMGSQEAIKHEKSQLVYALPQEGIAVLNGASPLCEEVFSELNLENKFLANLDEVKNIKVSAEGCEFELFGVKCKTRLLGKHNIENIVMCARLAHELGVTAEQIAEAVGELEPTPHRLQLINADNGVVILDDSYNATAQGTQAALEVLGLFTVANRRVVQTPGIVELGKHANEVNFEYGKQIAATATDVIVVNQANREAIVAGLRAGDFDEARVHAVKSLDEAIALYPTLLSAGDVLLIANDLPDLFS